MKTKHRVIIGDARQMSRVEDKSVHLVVTSPPYWQLKDYGTDDQIGFDHTYEEYINNLNVVWQECCRVLHDGCRLCINVGDQFARSVYYGRYKVIPIRTEIIRFCETIGLDFMGSIVWQKVTTCNTSGGASIMGSFPYPRNGIVKIDYEHILLFKKHGKQPKFSAEAKSASKMTTEEWNLYFNGHWNFPGEKQKDHLAMFPEELPRRLTKMFSFVGETVLDPFLGSGTTALAAANLGRNSVGYEINPDFELVIKEKMNTSESLFNKIEVSFEEESDPVPTHILERLPYRFKDPIAIDKKSDPRKLQFGSKIQKSDNGKSIPTMRVKEIISVDKVRLDNNLVVRLLGISPLQQSHEDALHFLDKKVKGQQVYLKYDTVKYDDADTLLAYLYLKNRTFINAHLIKHGFATVDATYDLTNKTLLKYGR